MSRASADAPSAPRTVRRIAAVPALLVLLAFTAGCTRPAEPVPAPVSARTVRHAGRSFTVVTVDLDRGALRLYWKRPDGSRYADFDNLKADLSRAGDELLFATNAGIFEPGFV